MFKSGEGPLLVGFFASKSVCQFWGEDPPMVNMARNQHGITEFDLVESPKKNVSITQNPDDLKRPID